MSYTRLTHWHDGRISPCLTQDILTGMMDEYHHILDKTYSMGRWTNITMSYRRPSHWDDERISPCLTEDFFTGMMDEYHHVFQKTCSLGRWTNITMSYRRCSHWDDGRISLCLTGDFITGMMVKMHHGLHFQNIYSLSIDVKQIFVWINSRVDVWLSPLTIAILHYGSCTKMASTFPI